MNSFQYWNYKDDCFIEKETFNKNTKIAFGGFTDPVLMTLAVECEEEKAVNKEN